MFLIEELTYIKRLGGLTNLNFLVAHKGRKYVLRFPAHEFEDIINRQHEKENQQIAAEIGVTVGNVVFTDDGIKMTPYYDATAHLTRDLIVTPEYLEKVADVLSTLHSSKREFTNRFMYWEEVEKYKSALTEIPSIYVLLEERMRKLMQGERQDYVSCHMDSVTSNFIQNDAKQLLLIDWEYSANYLPEWDLAAFILERELNEEQEQLLLGYYGLLASSKKSLDLQKLKLDFLWSLWSLVKEKEDPSYEKYTSMRTERLIENLEQYYRLYGHE
ncbi:choline kinase family protein [Sporosarcina sp. GW1-11]|uniref:choline kinase family protein n=1 Tax=Sporosarcina sp. GW1-11 TaxID=2899126 RepID=UPI00294E4B55|nr:choline kinase family protein [Sporosarcina sp. GW1-11]MDV6376970.1 choline kinase family protein [Sporosarcina sp. GW1-11]